MLPDLHDVDDAIRQSTRVLDNLARIKEAIIAQQTAIAEQRARNAKGEYFDDEYSGLHDDYKSGGFSGGDAKKRRGVSFAHSQILNAFTDLTKEGSTAWPLPQL